MISRCIPLVLAIVVYAPGIGRAQTQPASPNQEAFRLYSYNWAFSTDPTSHDKMYEDIEILRRILDRKLEPLYRRINHPNLTLNPYTNSRRHQFNDLTGWAQLLNSNPNYIVAQNQIYPQTVLYNTLNQPNTYFFSPPYNEEVLSSLEGVYLKGQGVVYTATVSSLKPSAKAEPAKSKPVSEWERVRREIRNEKEEQKKPEAAKPPELSDVLLKVLFENGQHFSQLDAKEKLTIILTVHDHNPPAAAAKSAGKKTNKSTQPSANGKATIPDPTKEIMHSSNMLRDLEMLGELHLKKGRYSEAIDQFQQILKLKPPTNHAAMLQRKLAQCYLALGKDEEAQKALKMAIELGKKIEATKDLAIANAKPAAAKLPIKMIISVSKGNIDRAVKEKMPFEEFRRLASVEMVGTANGPR